jgi:hypothetical protein
VVTLAVLLAGGPAHAQDEGAKGDAPKGKKGGSKGDAPAEGEAAEGAAAAAEDVGPIVEPREQWEAPPADEEKPRPEVAKPQKKAVSGDGKQASVGLLLGWGFKTDRRGLPADPYGLGLGLRGGYALDFGLYLGGYFVYYVGGSKSGLNAAVNVSGESHANYILFGAEVGYDWWVGDAILRPSLGIGPALALNDAKSVTGKTEVTGDVGLHPGIGVIIPIEDWFVGGDFRGNVITGDGISSIALYATGGLRF